MLRGIIGIVAVASLPAAPTAVAQSVDHELDVHLEPAAHELRVVDRIGLGGAAVDDGGGFRFVLHAGLEPEVQTTGWRLQRIDDEAGADFVGINATSETSRAVPLEAWRLLPPDDVDGSVELSYGGVIHHPLETSGEEYQRSFSETPGIIDERGVFLAGTSYWIPTFAESMVSFSLEVSGLDPPWDVVSQGERVRHEVTADGSRTTAWRLDSPTEEVYLVAGPWHEWQERAGEVTVYVFLRDDEPALANRYLAATARYLKLYEGLLPRFPYRSFALVENFWETGYGMPGFTLLGPRVIRFPWILTSSYPHELLHNWWGNSVYVDLEQGNWCEGLTAYMADHLFAEQRGEGATYRRATLQKYSDFVRDAQDFPLAEFRSRHSAASEAVGYGKSLMLFHMLRRAVGDEAYTAALSRFYDDEQFSRASFDDIASAFEAETGGGWRPFIATWTGRAGAPRLDIADLRVEEAEGERPWTVHLHLRQSSDGEPFPMTVPVAVSVEGQQEPLWVEAGSCHRDCVLSIPCPGRPLRLDVDPLFDVMRRLDPLEVPPALSTVFGADDPLFVLPGAAGAAELEAWRGLAAAWAQPGEPRLALDSELDGVPEGPVWFLGWRNTAAEEIAAALEPHGVAISESAARVAGESVPVKGHSLVLVARSPADPALAVGWVAADPPAAIPGLARKLPHYTRYSYLGFRGDEPENVTKGTWRPLSSPLTRNLGGGRMPPLAVPVRSPLAELPPAYDALTLSNTVAELAAPSLEGRGVGSRGLERATEMVEQRFRELGLEPAGDDGYRQSWRWTGGEPAREMTLANVLAEIPGTDPELADRPVVLMAHLDHLGRGWPDVRAGNEGAIHPGADDNASGVAVLLEVARTMSSEPRRPRSVIFAVVTAEEAGRVGSKHLLESLHARLPFACVNLDTVGRLSDSGTVFVLNADSAKEWRFLFMGVSYTTGAPLKVVAEPLDSSDQMSCIEAGVPAVQLFTGPTVDYHRPGDTAETIDGGGMAVVAEAVDETVGYLAERTEPLTVTISGAAIEGDPAGERRASLGTMPDFGHQGAGVRVQQVMPGSAAEAAGIIAGDVVVAMDGEEVADLRGYSRLLKTHAPGDSVTVTVLRDGGRIILEAVLGAR